MSALTPDQLLIEVDDVIRAMPPRATIRHELPENFAWFGRASAVVKMWDPVEGALFDGHVAKAQDVMAHPATEGLRQIIGTSDNNRRSTVAGGPAPILDIFRPDGDSPRPRLLHDETAKFRCH